MASVIDLLELRNKVEHIRHPPWVMMNYCAPAQTPLLPDIQYDLPPPETDRGSLATLATEAFPSAAEHIQYFVELID